MREHGNTFKFDSLAAFADECQKGLNSQYTGRGACARWNSGESFSDSIRIAYKGDLQWVDEAERLVETVTSQICLDSPAWMPSCGGAYPVVPEFLLGLPECMRRRVQEPSERTPVRVWVCTSSSGGVDSKDLQARGVTILALILSLQKIRQVELWTYTSLEGDHRGDSVIKVRHETSSMCLSEVCWALCSQGYARNLTYGFADKHCGFMGGWAEGFRDPRKMLGVPETDVVIKPSHLDDGRIISDPVGWLKDVIGNYTTVLEDSRL
jgi:hypothetical protein